jgi:hypothetical protein
MNIQISIPMLRPLDHLHQFPHSFIYLGVKVIRE